MRDLTEDELCLISGGYDWDNEDIVVTGSPYPPTYPPYWYPPVFSPGGYTPPPPPPYYGGGGGSPPPPPPTPCEERGIDNEAWEVAREIGDTYGPFAGSTEEYISVLYRDASGTIQHTPIATQGSDTNVSTTLTGIRYADIVGLIHTHPFEASNEINELNKMPSPGDWAQFDSLISNGASASALRTYIVGPDGHIRQYDSSSSRTQVSGDEVSGQQSC